MKKLPDKAKLILERYKDWNVNDIDDPDPTKFPNWRQVLRDLHDLVGLYEAGYEDGWDEGYEEGEETSDEYAYDSGYEDGYAAGRTGEEPR